MLRLCLAACVAAVMFLLPAAGLCAAPADTTATDLPEVTPIGLRAVAGVLDELSAPAGLGVRAWSPAPDQAPAEPGLSADEAFGLALDSVVYDGPTLDSLSMSRWERLWWGRGGVFRVTRLFPTHPEDPAQDFRQIARVRHRMLDVHQKLGLVTVAAMTAHVIAGQVALSTNRSAVHKTLAPVTIGLYSATAALSLLSPPPLFRGSGGVDTITIHKWLALGHVAGMILTPLLAPDEVSERRLHQVLGYSTYAAFSAAMITVTFFR